jgi:hypothetical protein
MKSFDKLCENLVTLEQERFLSEEFSRYGDADTVLYPTPATTTSTGLGFRGAIDMIDASIRKQVLALNRKKSDDESIVYSFDKKEALIIKKDELGDYTQKGYSVIFEEVNVTFGGSTSTDTSGSFDKVAGYDLPLFKKNKKELKKYKGKVFEVPSHIFRRLKEGHPRYTRWADYIHEEDDANFIDIIKKYSMRNPRSPIVIRNEEDGDMAIMRRRTNDARLKHNRSK